MSVTATKTVTTVRALTFSEERVAGNIRVRHLQNLLSAVEDAGISEKALVEFFTANDNGLTMDIVFKITETSVESNEIPSQSSPPTNS